MRRDSFAVVVIVAWAISMSPPVHSQAARLQISSPRDGTIVQPGSTVAITVTSPAGTLVSSVVVVGQTPLNLFQGSATLPFTTSAMVPVDAPLRRIRLSAMARTPAGREIDVEAAPIFIDVERNDMPTRLSLLNMGEKDPASTSKDQAGICRSSCSPILPTARSWTQRSRRASAIRSPLRALRAYAQAGW